jgi:hypothetical protein
MTTRRTWTAVLAVIGLVLAAVPTHAQERGGPTPPRLAFIDGEVSFWRPGAQDWVPAQVNTALAEGDQIYAAEGANVELQIGTRAFVRAGSDTQLGLEALDEDTLQFQLTGGHAAFDLARLPSGTAIEIDTPRAAFTIERPGYYRVDVDDQRTAFSARRGGVAHVVAENGDEIEVASDQGLVLADGRPFAIEAASAPDEWDRWNTERTSGYGAAPRSAPYVPEDVAGVDDLDRYGEWQEEPRYGRVWRPREVAPDWSPYSAGRWVYDPYYEWTWVDDAPWGWAPYHYGRWVYTSGFWGWAPGPLVVHPVYAPALVAFFGAPGVGVSVSVGAPFVSWCPLGFGEPVIPWWGGAAFVGRPYWGGWGGPRIVNNVVINNTRIVNAGNITHFQNFGVRNAVVGIDHDHFGRGGRPVRIGDHNNFRPLHGNLGVRPAAQSFVPHEGRGRRPPEQMLHRPVVATRPPRDHMQRLHARGIETAPAPVTRPQARVVHGRGGANRRAAEGTDGNRAAPGAPGAADRLEHGGGGGDHFDRGRAGGERFDRGHAGNGRVDGERGEGIGRGGGRNRADRGDGMSPPPPPRGQARHERGGGAPMPPRSDGRAGGRGLRDDGLATPPGSARDRGRRAARDAVERPAPPRSDRRLQRDDRGVPTPPHAGGRLDREERGAPPRAGRAFSGEERGGRREMPRPEPRGERRMHEPRGERPSMNVPRDPTPVPVPRGDQTRFERRRGAPVERAARGEQIPRPTMRREAPRMERAPARPASREQPHGQPGHGRRQES